MEAMCRLHERETKLPLREGATSGPDSFPSPSLKPGYSAQPLNFREILHITSTMPSEVGGWIC